MRKFWIIITVLAVLAAAFWFGRPAYRAHKEKRFAGQARAALIGGEQRKALLSAQQALVLNSNNLVACRVMADIADGSRSPHAIVWRRRVAEIEPTVENKIMLAACALRYEPAPFSIAAQTLESLGTNVQDSVPFHSVSTQLALKQNRVADAEKHLERAIQLEPTNALHRINLAVMRLESKDPAVSAKARTELEQWQTDSRWSGNALRALLLHHAGRRQFADAEKFSTVLLRGTNALFSDKLEHLTILHAGKSPALESFLDKLQREAATNVLYAADMVVRMTALDRANEAVVWSKSLPAVLQNELPLPIAVAEAHGAAKDWRGLEAFLTRQQWRERDFLRQALLAYAVRQQGPSEVSAVHWREAVQLADERPELMLMLAQLASSWGWTNETEAVLWSAARDFPRERWPIDSLQSSYARMRTTRGLFEVNTLLLERDPTNAIVQNNWATLALLLQTNATKAHQLARQVYDRDTNNPGFLSTYAWSLHLQGKTVEGLQLMDRLTVTQLEDPSMASYYGVMLAAAGQKEKAQRYFAKAEAAEILPEELQMVVEAKKADRR